MFEEVLFVVNPNKIIRHYSVSDYLAKYLNVYNKWPFDNGLNVQFLSATSIGDNNTGNGT